MRLTVRSFLITALFLIAGSAKAQFAQYTQPGGPEERPEDRKLRLERELEQARFRLGPARLAPVFGVRDVAYVRSLFAEGEDLTADLTATMGAGFRAYLPTGRKVTWIATVVPEYVWWRERSEARRLNQRYGLRTLGFFNHLTVEASAARDEVQAIVTPEVPELVSSRADRAALDAELRLTGATSVFTSLGRVRHDNIVDQLDNPRTRGLDLLDRREQVVRAGVRWRPRTGWTLGLGAERSQVDFERSVNDSSNSGTGPAFELLFDRRRVFVQIDAVARSLTAREGSRFVDFNGVTGGASASAELGRQVSLTIYGNRNLVYSLSPTEPYLDDRRIGIATGVGLAERLSARAFVETGTHRYVNFLPQAPRHVDDFRAVGGGVRLDLPGQILVQVQAVRTTLDSNLPGGDRTFTAGGVSVLLGGNLLRGSL